MTCATCKFWLLRRETRYDNETIINWVDQDGRGKCTGPLKGALTPSVFECNEFAVGGPVVEITTKPGEPYHYWRPGPCPDCKRPECGFRPAEYTCTTPNCPGPAKCLGLAAKADPPPENDRCQATGTVQYYDDGYIADNKTKMHPKEKEFGKRDDDPTPTCFNCRKSVEPTWSACPFCGTRLRETSDPRRGAAIQQTGGGPV